MKRRLNAPKAPTTCDSRGAWFVATTSLCGMLVLGFGCTGQVGASGRPGAAGQTGSGASSGPGGSGLGGGQTVPPARAAARAWAATRTHSVVAARGPAGADTAPGAAQPHAVVERGCDLLKLTDISDVDRGVSGDALSASTMKRTPCS